MQHRDDIPEDLEWLARNVSGWKPGEGLAGTDGTSFIWKTYTGRAMHCGPSSIIAITEPQKCFSYDQWLQARQLLGLEPVDGERWSDWIEWSGGECPLPAKTFHQVKLSDGGISEGDAHPRGWDWNNLNVVNIIAYRYRLDDNTATPEEDEAWKEMEEKQSRQKYSAYFKDVRHIDTLDVYRTVDLFGCEKHGHAISHAAKKLLLTGARTGGKDVETEVREAIDSLLRWLEMREEDASALRAGELGE